MPFVIWGPALLIATFFASGLALLELPLGIIYGFIVGFLILIIILTRITLIRGKQSKTGNFYKGFSLFCAASFIYLLILSSGGIQSMFMSLLYLMIISLAFLVGLRSAFYFTGLSIILLMLMGFLAKGLNFFTQYNINVLILYVSSFIVIIPVVLLINNQYKIKERLLDLITQELNLHKKRQLDLLMGLNEFVVLTDTKLTIIASNEVIVRRIVPYVYSDLVGKSFFKVFFLKNDLDILVNEQNEGVNQLFKEKKSVSLDPLYLHTPNSAEPYKISLTMTPLLDLDNNIEQIEFVLGFNQIEEKIQLIRNTVDFQPQRMTIAALLQQIKTTSVRSSSTDIVFYTEVLERQIADVSLAFDIEGGGISIYPVLLDVTSIVRNVIAKEKTYADLFKVKILYSIEHLPKLQHNIHLSTGLKVSAEDLTGPYFTSLLDTKLLAILVTKILDGLVYLSYGVRNNEINMIIDRDEQNIYLNFGVKVLIKNEQVNAFFDGNINKSKSPSSYDSGLEGYIIKHLVKLLNIRYIIDTSAHHQVQLIIPRHQSENEA